MYTIKSVSHEGTWYLVNGWWKYKTYWQQKDHCGWETTFKREADAKRSLTKLLKDMMEEYGDDQFIMVRFDYDERHYCYNEVELYEIKIEK